MAGTSAGTGSGAGSGTGTGTATLPWGRALRRSDLAGLPDDGHRYELLDGSLLVSPAPGVAHQDAVLALALLLSAACPPGLKVMVAPTAVALGEDTELQPDVLVADRSALTARELLGPPLLAVEVLSPSTRRVDQLLKRDRLQAAGCPAFWLVDLDRPAVTVLELAEGAYAEREVVGADTLPLTWPWPLRLCPADLVDR